MNTPKFNLTLALLGLVTFVATPSVSYAQEELGKESTQGVEVGEATGTVEKIDQKTGDAEEKAGKKSKRSKKDLGSKTTKEQRKLMREVASEMGKYRANSARLKQARSVGEKKNDTDLLKKANQMEPKLEAQHKAAMDALRVTYGEKEVAAAVERLNNQSRADLKKRPKFVDDATKKGSKQAKETKGKGKQKQKRRKGKEEGSDS